MIYESLTNCPSFPYLVNFIAAGSRVGAIELSFPVFRDIHLAPKTFVIYNSTSHSSNSQASLYLGSHKVSKHLSHPSQCKLIMLWLLTTHHTGSRALALIRKPRGHPPLKHIKPRFTPYYIIRYLLHMLCFILLYGKIQFHSNFFVPAIYLWVDSFSIIVK